jgi:hypothetical protein
LINCLFNEEPALVLKEWKKRAVGGASRKKTGHREKK